MPPNPKENRLALASLPLRDSHCVHSLSPETAPARPTSADLQTPRLLLPSKIPRIEGPRATTIRTRPRDQAARKMTPQRSTNQLQRDQTSGRNRQPSLARNTGPPTTPPHSTPTASQPLRVPHMNAAQAGRRELPRSPTDMISLPAMPEIWESTGDASTRPVIGPRNGPTLPSSTHQDSIKVSQSPHSLRSCTGSASLGQQWGTRPGRTRSRRDGQRSSQAYPARL
jgi:hypothetical protein